MKWVHVHRLRAEKKMEGGKFTGEICKCTPGRKCTPEAEQESIFRKLGEIWAVGEAV